MAASNTPRDQARMLALQCVKEYDFAALNAVRAWIGTDQGRSQLFKEEFGRAEKENDLLNCEEDFPPSSAVSTNPPTLPTEVSGSHTPLQELAFNWMRCMQLKHSEEVSVACYAWRKANLQHYIEYNRWHCRWLEFWVHKEGRIFAGKPTTEMPDLATLSPAQFEAIVEAERSCILQERSAWLKCASQAHSQRLCTSFGETRQHHMDEQYFNLNMNTETQVEVTPELTRRRIVLLAGEIGLLVGECLHWPLEVHVDDMQFVVEGEALQIRRYSRHHIDLTVIEGTVHVRSSAGAPLPERLSCIDQMIACDHQMRITPERVTVTQLHDMGIFMRLSWCSGNLYFHNATLEEAVEQYNRYRKELLVLADRSLAPLLVSGNYLIDDVELLLGALRQEYGIDTQRIAGEGGAAPFIRLARATSFPEHRRLQ